MYDVQEESLHAVDDGNPSLHSAFPTSLSTSTLEQAVDCSSTTSARGSHLVSNLEHLSPEVQKAEDKARLFMFVLNFVASHTGREEKDKALEHRRRRAKRRAAQVYIRGRVEGHRGKYRQLASVVWLR